VFVASGIGVLAATGLFIGGLAELGSLGRRPNPRRDRYYIVYEAHEIADSFNLLGHDPVDPELNYSIFYGNQ
jgi:hypothetical protein